MEALALQTAGSSRSIGPDVLLEGKYRLERVLGAGAMGRVWLARNTRLDAPVAIKLVEREEHGTDSMARVVTEARLEARLRHPNIVRVLDCHADHDLSYVVMELLEGCTLSDLMDEGPLPPALAVRLLLPLLDGLALAHEAGVVHRDIKPENVFLARTGDRVCPKLLDFGVAHVADDTGSARKRRLIVGTPGYMAPEQAYGERDSDARADLWSVGVVLYEAITGHSAFESPSYQTYLRALNERELPALPESGGGAELWRIVRRALSVRWQERTPSACELADALRGWLRCRGVCEDLSGDSLPASWVMPGSILDQALQRAAARHTAYAERDSLAPTQPDLTARRRAEQCEAQQTSAVSGARAISRRRLQPLAANASRDDNTIRTLPRRLQGRVRKALSGYALVAGALLGIGAALFQTHGAAFADQPQRSRERALRVSDAPQLTAARPVPAAYVVASAVPEPRASLPRKAPRPHAAPPERAHRPISASVAKSPR